MTTFHAQLGSMLIVIRSWRFYRLSTKVFESVDLPAEAIGENNKLLNLASCSVDAFLVFQISRVFFFGN
jgi:hypothetical protein